MSAPYIDSDADYVPVSESDSRFAPTSGSSVALQRWRPAGGRPRLGHLHHAQLIHPHHPGSPSRATRGGLSQSAVSVLSRSRPRPSPQRWAPWARGITASAPTTAAPSCSRARPGSPRARPPLPAGPRAEQPGRVPERPRPGGRAPTRTGVRRGRASSRAGGLGRERHGQLRDRPLVRGTTRRARRDHSERAGSHPAGDGLHLVGPRRLAGRRRGHDPTATTRRARHGRAERPGVANLR